MFNLNRLLELVKKGEFFNKSFNIKKSRNNRYDEYDQLSNVRTMEELDPEIEQDDAALWLSQQNQKIPDEGYVQQPSSGISTKQPLPPHIEESMYYWIKNNIEEINYEGTKDLITLIDQKNKNPEASMIGVDVSLSRELVNNISYQYALSDKIKKNFPNLEDVKSDIFVETMLEKAKLIPNSIKEVEDKALISKPDPEQVQDLTPVKEKQTQEYNTFIGAYARFLPESLSEEEKMNIGSVIYPGEVGTFYTEDMLEKAVRAKLSAPEKPGILDQRMNFFLRNPQLLLDPKFSSEGSIFDRDPSLEPSLREGLQKIGIVDNDITIALGKVYRYQENQDTDEGMKAKKFITDILKREAGPELLDILQKLIESADPIIAQWFKPALFGANKGDFGAHYTGTTEEGKALEGNLVGKVPSESKRDKVTEQNMDDTSKQIASLTKNYLDDQLSTINLMKEATVQQIMLQQIDKFKQAELDLAINKSKKGGTRDAQNKLNAQLKKYTNMESMNGFATYAIDQLNAVFNELGRGRKEEYREPGKKENSIILYRNEAGSVSVPLEILKQIYGIGAKDRSKYEGLSLDQYSEYVNIYKDAINSGEIKDYYQPNWNLMVNRRVPYNALADIYEIKMKIKEIKENDKNATIDSIYLKLNSVPKENHLLDSFSGISSTDKDFEKQQKKQNFIYMTLMQDEDSLKTYKKCYESRKKYKEKREQVSSDKNLTERQKRLKISKINDEEAMGVLNPPGSKKKRGPSVLKQMKGYVSQNYWPILASVVDNIQRSDQSNILKHQAKKDFIKLFDAGSSQYRSYERTGKTKNELDPLGRSNTELYYLATEGKIPNRVQNIINFEKEQDKEKDPVKKEWYKNFFNEYQLLFKQKEEVKGIENLINEKKESLKDYIINVMNHRANAAIENPIEFKKVLKRVPSEMLQKFQEDLLDWNRGDILPNLYYKWMGLKAPIKARLKRDKEIKRYEKDLIEAKDKVIDIENKLKAKLQKAGKYFNIYALNNSALKLVYAEYRRSISKIKKLLKIKKYSYKFAHIQTQTIDDIIKGIRIDFDNFFNHLIM